MRSSLPPPEQVDQSRGFCDCLPVSARLQYQRVSVLRFWYASHPENTVSWMKRSHPESSLPHTGPSPPSWLSQLPREDPWSTPFAEHLLAKLDLPIGATVLDVTCGAGLPTFHLAYRVGPSGRVVGLDLSDAQVARAQAIQASHFPWLQFRCADVRSLPADLGRFDRITGNLSFMFFRPNRAACLNQLVGFLQPRGQIVLTFPSLGTFDSLWQRVEKEMADRGLTKERQALAEYVAERPSAADARDWLRDCGLKRVEVSEWPIAVETAAGDAFLSHPLLRGGFLDDVYECFSDAVLAEDVMQTIAHDLPSFLPLIARCCVMSGWRPGQDLNADERCG